MAIVITDNLDCLVDGVNFGQPADVIANNLALAPAVNVAMRAKLDEVRAASSAGVDAANAEKTTAIAAANATATAEKAAIVAAAAAEKSALEAEKATIETEKAVIEAEKGGAITALEEIEAAALANPEDLQAIVLKSIEGRRSEIERKKAEHAANIAREQAALDALNAK